MPEASAVFKDCQGRWRTCFVFVYFSHKSLWPLDNCAPKYQGIQNSLAYNFSNGIASPPTWIDLGHSVFQMVSHRQELLPATQQPSNIISTEQNSSKTVHCNYWEQFGVLGTAEQCRWLSPVQRWRPPRPRPCPWKSSLDVATKRLRGTDAVSHVWTVPEIQNGGFIEILRIKIIRLDLFARIGPLPCLLSNTLYRVPILAPSIYPSAHSRAFCNLAKATFITCSRHKLRTNLVI